ncbi:MAG: hypothetical protein L6Q54_13380 [Leptospiraceae bacterium]|nr:hypothetical protein [Leptospiraceae bacterium]MCK6382227.1 hypothetical protein [Leptospiraceae bacterium]
MNTIYSDYLKEKRLYRYLNYFFKIFGYGSIALFFYLLWGLKYTEPHYVILPYFGLYVNLSTLVLHKYFEIPRIFFLLQSENTTISDECYSVIDKNREEILKPVIVDLFGWSNLDTYISSNKEEIISFLNNPKRIDWKKIGKWYFTKFTIISLFSYWFAFS